MGYDGSLKEYRIRTFTIARGKLSTYVGPRYRTDLVRYGSGEMIKLSKLSDYGVVLMTELARCHGQGSLTARDLAAELGLPLPTVSKLLKLLAKGSLLDSQRGAKGGYSLAREPKLIDLAQILTALEGPVSMTACVDGDCKHIDSCGASSSWHWINQRVIEALREVTLADMGGSPLMDPARNRSESAALPLEIEGR